MLLIIGKKKKSGVTNTAVRSFQCVRRGCCITLLSIAVLAINQQTLSLNEGQLGNTREELGRSLWEESCGGYTVALWKSLPPFVG